MNTRVFGCYRFRRISNESLDRVLSERERRFLDKHRAVCPACLKMEFESASALDALRSVQLEALPDPFFEDRVIRRLRSSHSSFGLRSWAPAMVGASIACITIIAALQMVTLKSGLPGFKAGNHSAMLDSRSEIPLLLFDQPRSRYDSSRNR